MGDYDDDVYDYYADDAARMTIMVMIMMRIAVIVNLKFINDLDGSRRIEL